MAEYSARDQASLQKALDKAGPGDTILVYGGKYDRPSTIKNKNCTSDKPIIIRAADGNAISGEKSPPTFKASEESKIKRILDLDIRASDPSFLKIINCRYVTVENLIVWKWWPSIFFVEDSRNISIRGCDLKNGTHAIFATGETSHLLIENNKWKQDDSVNHDLWHKIDWRKAHGGEGKGEKYAYFNGGFLSSRWIQGKVVVRCNQISDAYNGIRMVGSAPAPRKDGIIDKGTPLTNCDVHIVKNEFIRIRDNPVEPEKFAINWHIRENRIVDCHSWFSFDDVGGGYWYIYGNDGRFTSRQGRPWDESHSMGRILKLGYSTSTFINGKWSVEKQRVPDYPWYVFNNSWHLRCPIISGSNPSMPFANAGPEDPEKNDKVEGPDYTANLNFFNNAFVWCDPTLTDNWVCESIDLVRCFDWSNSSKLMFDRNVSNRADYLNWMQKKYGAELNGKFSAQPIFEDPVTGYFKLSVGSAALKAGFDPGVDCMTGGKAGIQLSSGGTLDCGKFQDYGPVKVQKLEDQYDVLVKEMGGGSDGKPGWEL